jgi:prolyl 4-hydroxylase
MLTNILLGFIIILIVIHFNVLILFLKKIIYKNPSFLKSNFIKKKRVKKLFKLKNNKKIFNKVNNNNKIYNLLDKLIDKYDKIISIENKIDIIINNFNKTNFEDDRILDSNKFILIENKLKDNRVEDKYIYNYVDFLKNNITNKYYDILINYINIKPYKLIEKFLSIEECNNLLELAKDKYEPSRINTHNENVNNIVRSSNTYYCNNPNKFIIEISKKISDLLNIDIKFLENLQITKYKKLENYKLHYDYADGEKFMRKYSIIIYLNNLSKEDGGETHFPLFNTKITPKKGMLIYFDNLFENGVANNLTIHEGLPVLTDNIKYILTTWSRQEVFV